MRKIKKYLAACLAVLLVAAAMPMAVFAEEDSHVTVGNTTKVSGSFFTTQFGNNTSDIDVRDMIHGYDPVVWTSQLTFSVDEQVVLGVNTRNLREGTQYQVMLQNDLTWNDGTPITAKDYVFSYLLLASDEIAAIGAETGAYKHVYGYENYNQGKADVFSGIRLLDDYTFSVTVKRDYLPYFYELSYLSVNPYPISVLAPDCEVKDDGKGAYIANKSGGDTALFTAELLEKTILGTSGYLSSPQLTCGPYNLKSYDPQSGTVEFTLNTYYKGNYEGIKPTIKHVTLKPSSPATMAKDMEDGKYDILNKVVSAAAIDSLTELSDKQDILRQSYPRLGYGFLSLSCETGPQQYTEVRQALAYAFDRAAFVQKYVGDYGVKIDGYYGVGQWMYRSVAGTLRPDNITESESRKWDALSLAGLNTYEYNLEKAEQKLERAGFRLNETGAKFVKGTDTLRYKKMKDGTLMPLTFRFAQCEGNEAAALVVKMLSESLQAIGGSLDVTVLPFTELLSDYYRENDERRFDMAFMATNFVATFDPYMTFSTGDDFDGSINTSGLNDKELLKYAWRMHSTEPMDLLGYLRQWIKFQQRYNDQLPTIPLYSNDYYDFSNARVVDYAPGVSYNWPEAILKASVQ